MFQRVQKCFDLNKKNSTFTIIHQYPSHKKTNNINHLLYSNCTIMSQRNQMIKKISTTILALFLVVISTTMVEAQSMNLQVASPLQLNESQTHINVHVPAASNWGEAAIVVYDVAGFAVINEPLDFRSDKRSDAVEISALPAGQYTVLIISGQNTLSVKYFTKN